MDKNTDTVERVKEWCKNTMIEHLGIEITEVGDDFLCARMPVDQRTHQPMGLLHGGASVVLAESLASMGAALKVDLTKKACVGLEINANHLRSAREGWVYGKATPIHVGRSTQVWETKVTNEAGELVCISRMTVAVIDKK
ncbi:hotdog fold thioesterase [Pontibacter chinhatensis]|uniref:1,4-dihydroxy-2-naphthoyl-CoA hydrolase n=1 Tax=Pontibacter chinhatensis TaxID=1436961 RepID=A0A1I2NHA1_9BACT|nr:hotdog fold thioesterase [Pontibacter chinhatensis]SFG03325.1 1,4-dihydroxy-2-naphthoyl-CoA hydrolase [Pontibacter chinhatensis]